MDIKKEIRTALYHQQAGNMQQAELICRKVLKKQSKNVDILNLIGVVCGRLGRYNSAIQYLEKALKINPSSVVTYLNLGLVVKANGQLDKAITYYKKALKIDPNFTDAYFNIGNVLREKGEFDDAIAYYQQGLQLNPADIDAYLNLGNTLREQGQLNEAVECYKKALKIDSNFIHAYTNIGDTLREQERLDEAIIYLNRAVQIKPDSADVLNNLGLALQQKGKLDDAITCLQRAIVLNPSFKKAYHNLGTTFHYKGQLDMAIKFFRRAIELDPNCADSHTGISFPFLIIGKFKEGWDEYEWRLKTKDHYQNSFLQSIWDGSSLNGKSIFVYTEQGVGDEIMFASCLPEIINEADVCIVECEKRLVPLFTRSFSRARVLERIKESNTYRPDPPKTDWVIAIGSLPKYLRPDLTSFPRRHSYLIADAQKTELWQRRYEKLGKGLKVGISWRGSKEQRIREQRSIDLEQLRSLFLLSGVHFINLQYGDCNAELKDVAERLNIMIHDWDDANPLKDLDNFASQITALDLVISVDNATVHMASALGVPVWALIPFVPDWRWMQGYEDSPWYESVRLFRQSSPGQWDSVLERVVSSLREYIESGVLPGIRPENSYKTGESFHTIRND